MACGVPSSFEAVPGIDTRALWRDALATATAAHKLAACLAAVAQEACVCGLLHTTGHQIQCRSYPDSDAIGKSARPLAELSQPLALAREPARPWRVRFLLTRSASIR